MAVSAFETPLYIFPEKSHTHTIIALHGRGSQGPEFKDELFESQTSASQTLPQALPGCKWVFPSSQERYSTVFQEGLDEWFDIYSLTDPATREELQIEGIHDSVEFILKILKEEADIVGFDRIILLGLSQGSAIGLLTLLATSANLCAYIGLSGWLPFRSQIQTCANPHNLHTFLKTQFDLIIYPPASESQDENESTTAPRQSLLLHTPVFLGHTGDDEIIDVELGRQARDVLRGLGMDVVWREEETGGHLGMLKTGGLDGVVAFLREKIG